MEEETIDHGASSVEDDCGEDSTKIDIDFADHSSADALLANELYHLSVEERDMINEEIHGIWHQCQNETPELLQNSLKQLAVELVCLPSKQAYDASQAFPECYINTDDFRLIFLRCEFFDAHKAAVRMTKYLDLIHWAFGEKVLQRDVCIADLDEQTLKLLRAGPFQVLPGMDRTGRRVVGNFAAEIDPDQPRINRVRKRTRENEARILLINAQSLLFIHSILFSHFYNVGFAIRYEHQFTAWCGWRETMSAYNGRVW